MGKLSARTEITTGLTLDDLLHLVNGGDSWKVKLSALRQILVVSAYVDRWTARAAAEANSWASLAWSPSLGIFAAVGETGTNRVMTSPDGITWTARAAAEANTWQDVCWAASLGLFVAVSSDGTNQVQTSPDGITWTARAAISGGTSWQDVAWSDELGILVSIGAGGSKQVMTSRPFP